MYFGKQLLFLLLAPLSLSSSANPILSTIGLKILGVAVTSMSELASEKIMTDMGVGAPYWLETVTEQLNSIEASVNGLSEKIDDQNFKASLAKSLEAVTQIKTETLIVHFWETSNIVPDANMLTNQLRNLLQALLNLELHVNHPDVGVMSHFMLLNRYGMVSDLIQYYSDLDELRACITSALGSAVSAYERTARILDTAAKNCVYDQHSNYACRADSMNHGGPDDPEAQGLSNKYFDVANNTHSHSLVACQTQCTARLDDCYGVEYGISNFRCELWKVPIGGMKHHNAYGCYVKNPCVILSVTDAQLNYLFQKAKQIAKDMFLLYGVPLVEAYSHAGVPIPLVHVKNEDWALSAVNSFSGYFGTATKGRLYQNKLEIMSKVYDADKNGGRSMEKLLEDSGIPTDFIDQKSWKCKKVGGTAGYWGQILTVNIMGVTESSTYYKTVYLKAGSFNCQALLAEYKTQAGKNYRNVLDAEGSSAQCQSPDFETQDGGKHDDRGLNSEGDSSANCQSHLSEFKAGSIKGGLHIDKYYKHGCFDTDICHTGMSGPVNVNRSFYGRFYTYNLSIDDCKRMCVYDPDRCPSCGPTALGCLFCGRRLDIGGNAMQLSEDAVLHYIGWA
eukprot:scaffold43442_cov35-Attheya_sp.AAC.1